MLLLTAALLYSCKTDDEITNPGQGGDAAFQGTWKLDEVQITQTPSNPRGLAAIWKPALVQWGKVSATTIGNLELTFGSDTSWNASGYLTNSIVRNLVHDNGNIYSANGSYSKSIGTFTFRVQNYTGRQGGTGTASCSYSISGNKMTVNADLPDNEKWQLIFKKQ